ncbi:NgoMIV family type II restriction endonuclease [Roseiflexus castenholzii]|uniref:NgoMIV family type II restriction endonuclease n=1 Tax=Roseiflexus castenholzii TaxID=120962 RepID=UPI003C7BC690
MKISELRSEYHKQICENIVWVKSDKGVQYPNFADSSSRTSRRIALGVHKRINCGNHSPSAIPEQEVGRRFEETTRLFIKESLSLINHLRPAEWIYSTYPITEFDQHAHLAELERISKDNKELASVLGVDYIIKPDIVIGRHPVSDQEINRHEQPILDPEDKVVQYSPLRQRGQSSKPILHASISCKWTIRSDRSQNTRTEALNLIRNRKGHTPHIAAVTAEPLPTRIASLALGTGDLDCVYHIALPELEESIAELKNEDQGDMLRTLIQGKRLRDISDLPFDLVI